MELEVRNLAVISFILRGEGCNASEFLLLILNYVQYVDYVYIVRILF